MRDKGSVGVVLATLLILGVAGQNREIILDSLSPDFELRLEKASLEDIREISISIGDSVPTISNDSEGFKIQLQSNVKPGSYCRVSANNIDLSVHQTHESLAWNISLSGSCIELKGTILATLVYDIPETRNCVPGWRSCELDDDRSRERDNEMGRCIHYSLWCNSRQNCPDKDDEDDCQGRETDPKKTWYEVQYLLTILLAGLFFILSPICIVIFLFYHRRMNAARVELERAHRAPPPNIPEVYTTSSPPNDIPPSYDDVHDLKNMPPSFETLNTAGSSA